MICITTTSIWRFFILWHITVTIRSITAFTTPISRSLYHHDSHRQWSTTNRDTKKAIRYYPYDYSPSLSPSHNHRRHVLCNALTTTGNNDSSSSSSSLSQDVLTNKRILVVGGSGRVGGSVVVELTKRGAIVAVGGTSEENFIRSRDRWLRLNPTYTTPLSSISFHTLQRSQPTSVRSVLQQQQQSQKKFDLVVHAAGPFQGRSQKMNGILDACVSEGVPYIDVCDDFETAMAAKERYGRQAAEGGDGGGGVVPCIVGTGCWPGVSSLMAKLLINHLLTTNPSIKRNDLSVNFSFFTAGSGGAGATLLVATFLILAEKALMMVQGEKRPVQPMKEYSTANFGPIVGDRLVAPLNLLETASIHKTLGIPNTSSLFGTAPSFWNTLLGVMAQLPPSLLSNVTLMSRLAVFSLPIVRIVDAFAGATNAMRCDVSFEDKNKSNNKKTTATAIYAHENLEPCVGDCIVAFCVAVLADKVKPGIWFPEEAMGDDEDVDREVLRLAGQGAHTLSCVRGDGVRDDALVWGETKKETMVVGAF